ncbi:kelch-like protein 8 isoform X2 [Haliotis rufescens]|uniref:kelch-like protein 8 isoform X2 n=1 Tax=Haliotis rufescens TaxID=6454 RepID=UPI001EAFE15D|nr:kelch-like protein 8 isoform X2 [Haliotis rufescens]
MLTDNQCHIDTYTFLVIHRHYSNMSRAERAKKTRSLFWHGFFSSQRWEEVKAGGGSPTRGSHSSSMPQNPPVPLRKDSLPNHARKAPPIPPAPSKRNHSHKSPRPSSEYHTLRGASAASPTSRKMSHDSVTERLNLDMTSTHTHEERNLWKDSFKTLLEFYENGQLCDVEIIVGERSFKCHRTVLACASLYFRAMFMSEMAESKQETVTIHDIDAHAMEKLIQFAYTSKITLTIDTVQQLLYASSILQMEAVAQACCDFMKTQLTPSNCIDVHNFAEQHNRVELMKTATDYLLSHFLEVVEGGEFKVMNKKLLEKLISSFDLNVENEVQVYEAVINWVKNDLETRSEFLPSLLEHVKLPLVSATYLMETVEKEELMRNSLACRDFLDEAKYFRMSQVSLVPGVKVTPRTRERKSYSGVLFCVGGRGATGDPFKSIEVYDVCRNKWFHVAEMHTRRRHVGVCAANGVLYAVGGHDGNEHLNSGEVFDPKTNKWKKIAPMSTLRRGIALSCLGGPVYALGGLDDSTCFNTVERYDPTTNSWTQVASMNIPRGGVGVAPLKGQLYALGGNDGTSSLDKCERYDPFTNKWSPIASMNKRRAGAGVAVLDGSIFVAGGFDDNAPLDSVEKYDPSTDSWSLTTSMSCCRGGVGVGMLGGKLYAVGGHDGCNYLNSVESYDSLTDTWSSVRGIQQYRAGAGVAFCECPLKNVRKFMRGMMLERLQCV